MPAQRNSKALKSAWVSRWKKARSGRPIPSLAIITPSCLSVERAIIFFKSHSVIALRPAISIVVVATKRRVGQNSFHSFRNGKNRMSRKTPAVTKVEECTSAETGVGAAMAAGSHLENGIWALFVIAAIKIQITTLVDMGVLRDICRMDQCP